METGRRRGRPPLGNTGMVTVGVRLEPHERALLQQWAAEAGVSLCAFMRQLVRQQLGAATQVGPARDDG